MINTAMVCAVVVSVQQGFFFEEDSPISIRRNFFSVATTSIAQ